MARAVVFGAPIAFALVMAVVAFLVRRPIQHALYPDTGLREWRAMARHLSWSDRWLLYRAVGRGRAVTSRLAPLAVQRARMVLAILDTMRRRRYLWWMFGLLTVAIVLLLAAAVTHSRPGPDADPTGVRLAIGLAAYTGAVLAYMPWALRRTERRARDAIRVNLAQQGELPDLRQADQEQW